jgi:hypothetical protein
VRVRTLLTWTTGAAMGAGVMYLLDPEHGGVRRREARQQAAKQARDGLVRAALDARRRGEEVALAAVAGYQQSRQDAQPPAS